MFPGAGTKQHLLVKAQCERYILHANDFEEEKKSRGKQTDFECESCNQHLSLILLQHLLCIMWACKGRVGSRGDVKHLNAPVSASSAVLEKLFENYNKSPSHMRRGSTKLCCAIIS